MINGQKKKPKKKSIGVLLKISSDHIYNYSYHNNLRLISGIPSLAVQSTSLYPLIN